MFGFVCPELDGVTPQNIAAIGTPCFVRELPSTIVPVGSRCFFQGVLPGVAPYASTTLHRLTLVAGLATSPEFLPVDFLENAPTPAPVVTVNGAGEIVSLQPLDAAQLAAGVVSGVRIGFSGGVYCDVQGNITTVAAALAAGGASSAGVVGPLSVIYIEPPTPLGRGSDATGARGDAARPFATLDAALAVMLDGDTLELAPGTYEAPSAPIPASVTNGVIKGSSPASTLIQRTTPGSCLDFSSTLARGVWNIDNLRLAAQPLSLVIEADGAAAPPGSFFMNGALSFGFCTIQDGDIFARYCGSLVFKSCFLVNTGKATIETCTGLLFVDTLMLGAWTWVANQDEDDPLNPGGAGAQLDQLRFNGSCVVGSGGLFSFGGQGGLFTAPGAVFLAPITGDGLSISIGGNVGQFTLLGFHGGALDFASAPAKLLPDANNTIDLSGSTWSAPVSIALPNGSLSIVRVEGGGASFRAGALVTIGEAVLGNFRGAGFEFPLGGGGALATTGTGRVVPPTFALAPQPVAVPPATTDFLFGFRMPGPDYAVTLDADDATTLPLATTARTDLGFSVASTVGAGNLGAIVSVWGAY